MRDLNHQLKQICRDNRDGSYMTRSNRERMLALIANQLHELGYRGMGAHSLKPKHVDALVERWRDDALSPGTVKNRMSVLRWWAGKVNRQNVVARSNAHYGIPERRIAGNGSKAVTVEGDRLESVCDAHVRMSLELQRAFGLRREEAIKPRRTPSTPYRGPARPKPRSEAPATSVRMLQRTGPGQSPPSPGRGKAPLTAIVDTHDVAADITLARG